MTVLGVRRASLALLPLLAAGCHRAHDPLPPAKVPGAEVVACALAAGAALARDCTIERERTSTGVVLVLRHPDGGFRRLLVTDRGIGAADGAERASVHAAGPGAIEVQVAAERYRLPAVPAGG